MKASSTKTFCPTCEHQVVNGVACDWQPHYCPLQPSLKTSGSGLIADCSFMTLPRGEKTEYDVVRGFD